MQVPLQVKADDDGVADRRKRRRRRVLKKALIVFNGGNCDMGCQILDTSDTGAKLLPADSVACPNEFVLMPERGEARRCAVAWRRGAQVGVRYLTAEHQATMPDERRRTPRRQMMQKALIVFNNGHSTMPCRIVDTSDVGAKLIPADLYTCPREFVLKPEHSGPRLCAVIWRKGPAIGVQFL